MRRTLAVATALLVAGCGGATTKDGTTAPGVPDFLPALPSTARTLDADVLAADSLHPDELAHVLEQAGFVIGSEREFAGRSKTFEHVVVRRLRFGSAAGAERYLAWIR